MVQLDGEKTLTAVALFTLALVLGGLVGDRVLALTDEARDNLRVYTELINAAHDHYGVPVSYRDLVFASVQGMLRTLDPHTSFLPPDAYGSMREKQQTSFYGLGILVGLRDGQLTVISPVEGAPAARQGIQAGDVISTIEGEPTQSLTLDEAVQKLKGPKGTQVKLTIVRRGLDKPLALSVPRAEIPQTTVRSAYMLDRDTGYILLSEFARGSGRDTPPPILSIGKGDWRGSGNGGGYATPLILCTGNSSWNGSANATPLIPSIGKSSWNGSGNATPGSGNASGKIIRVQSTDATDAERLNRDNRAVSLLRSGPGYVIPHPVASRGGVVAFRALVGSGRHLQPMR